MMASRPWHSQDSSRRNKLDPVPALGDPVLSSSTASLPACPPSRNSEFVSMAMASVHPPLQQPWLNLKVSGAHTCQHPSPTSTQRTRGLLPLTLLCRLGCGLGGQPTVQ